MSGTAADGQSPHIQTRHGQRVIGDIHIRDGPGLQVRGNALIKKVKPDESGFFVERKNKFSYNPDFYPSKQLYVVSL